MTFREACEWYEREVLTELKDPEGREALRLRRLADSELGQISVARLGATDVDAYLRRRAREIESSVRRRTGVEFDHGRLRSDALRLDAARIASIYRSLRDRLGLNVSSPVTRAVRPLAGRGRAVKVSDVEVAKLTEAAPGALKHAIEFQIETALRPGELVNMKWSDVDFSGCRLALGDAKTGPRTVPLSARAVEILRSLKRRAAGADSSRVWQWTTTGGYSRVVTRAARGAGVNIHAHDLRHVAITRLLEAGLTIPEAAAVSGHKTRSMLRRYTEISVEHLARRLNEITKTKSSEE